MFHPIVIKERSATELCTLMDMTPEAVHSSRRCLVRRARGNAATVVAGGAVVAGGLTRGHG